LNLKARAIMQAYTSEIETHANAGVGDGQAEEEGGRPGCFNTNYELDFHRYHTLGKPNM
jgi:hypothetical protein